MGDISYLGKKRINTPTDIVGDVVVSGSLTTTGDLFAAGATPVTFALLEKMVLTEESTNLLNFEIITDSTGDVVIYEAV